ncbi:uncharacterized protein B0I36DRAFT_316558 [Microdochium trichocladiopsis]|uniref:C2H2-type domain-containing protein n=1 Tax=Microdochium trichocladiopsis TaxID=1682393 RepID=A0A9P9BW05_9PEZI|nr:uncharacterized protein B0I36DRAFT_316558 [Microdochium trichocladiopsis]KAH7034576.1 hypothetical protein B0I36DRAFT_316558 [Microdochium trichocladiopsis]
MSYEDFALFDLDDLHLDGHNIFPSHQEQQVVADPIDSQSFTSTQNFSPGAPSLFTHFGSVVSPATQTVSPISNYSLTQGVEQDQNHAATQLESGRRPYHEPVSDQASLLKDKSPRIKHPCHTKKEPGCEKEFAFLKDRTRHRAGACSYTASRQEQPRYVCRCSNKYPRWDSFKNHWARCDKQDSAVSQYFECPCKHRFGEFRDLAEHYHKDHKRRPGRRRKARQVKHDSQVSSAPVSNDTVSARPTMPNAMAAMTRDDSHITELLHDRGFRPELLSGDLSCAEPQHYTTTIAEEFNGDTDLWGYNSSLEPPMDWSTAQDPDSGDNNAPWTMPPAFPLEDYVPFAPSDQRHC